jgi:hypothetical protein
MKLYDNKILKDKMDELGLNPTKIAGARSLSTPTVYAVLEARSTQTANLIEVVDELGLEIYFREKAPVANSSNS